MGDSSTQQFIRERPVSFRALPRRALLAAPSALSLGAHACEGGGIKASRHAIRVPRAFTQFSCSGRSAHASSFAPEAIVEMSAAIPDGSSE
jgi:hypothetical protein